MPAKAHLLMVDVDGGYMGKKEEITVYILLLHEIAKIRFVHKKGMEITDGFGTSELHILDSQIRL